MRQRTFHDTLAPTELFIDHVELAGDQTLITARSQLAEQLASIQGCFPLSINDVPQIGKLFGQFNLETVQVKYTLSDRGSKDAQELIISKA